jgi:hypothetical protein
MGNVESVAQSYAHYHDAGEAIAPDSEHLPEGSNEHGVKLVGVGNLLKEVHEKVQALSESGAPVNEGALLELSTKLADAFKLCEGIEKDAALNGASNLGFAVLTKHPHITKCRPVCELLFDKDFCISLTNLKVELIRIERGEPESGPWLTNDEERQLEHWGEELADGAMKAWAAHFSGLGWPPAWGIAPNPGEEPFDVPDPFRALVCNLVWTRLNLWPKIKYYLDAWKVKGENIFPPAYWNDQIFLNSIVVEPRMVPWIIGVPDIDMHELATRDRYALRSNDKHREAYDALEQPKKDLVWTGIHHMRENKTGRQKRQRPSNGSWHASQYKWPRANMPRPRDLMGGTIWASR